MSGQQKFYITTAISYPNGPPHIGHAYEAIATDAIARFERLDGKDVFFLTGTDEHGLKMKQTAVKEGMSPRALADRNSARFRAMAEALNISNDDFIRTTEERHYRSSEEIWRRMESAERRHLPEKYAGWYSVRDEAFYAEERDHGRSRTACASDRRARRSNGPRRRRFLPPLGLPGQAARPLREAPRLHPAARAAQRGRELRQARPGGPLGIAHDARLGHPGAGRARARHVRVGRRADQLHHRRRAFPTRRPRAGAIGRPTCT